MIKKILIITFMFFFSFSLAEAKTTFMNITPNEVISTHYDEVEVGDILSFLVTKDVYSDDKIIIKKGTLAFGTVDFVHPNGWAGDSATIKVNKLFTTSVEGKKIYSNDTLLIAGNKDRNNDVRGFSIYIGMLGWVFRGAEIYLEPNKTDFNLQI